MLVLLRNDIARQYEVSAFHVLSNKSLIDLAKFRYDQFIDILKKCTHGITFHEMKHKKMYCRPSSIKNLLKIEDIAVEKANKYGKEMIEKIKSFCQETGAKLDAMPSQIAVTAKVRDSICWLT